MKEARPLFCLHVEQGKRMKSIWLIAGICVLGAWMFLITTGNAKKERAEQLRRQNEERIYRDMERQAEDERRRAEREDERIRKERAAAVAKEDAVRMFLRYIEKEEDRLKELIEESKLVQESITIDQQSLSDELVILGQQNEAESDASKSRGQKRRDEVEYVKRLLRSPVLNRLAETYLGEDLSAMSAEFRNRIETMVGLRSTLTNRREANMRIYEETIASVDGDVNQASRMAQDANNRVANRIKNSAKEMETRVEKLREKVMKLEQKSSKSPWEEKELKKLQIALEDAEQDLTKYRDVEGLADANKLQDAALLAETKARRRHVTALDKRTRADDAALEDHVHEVGIYNLASRYEERSLDAIRAAMRQRTDMMSLQISKAKKKLAFLKESSTNIDFLNADEIEAMRRRIAKRLSSNIVGEGVAE